MPSSYVLTRSKLPPCNCRQKPHGVSPGSLPAWQSACIERFATVCTLNWAIGTRSAMPSLGISDCLREYIFVRSRRFEKISIFRIGFHLRLPYLGKSLTTITHAIHADYVGIVILKSWWCHEVIEDFMLFRSSHMIAIREDFVFDGGIWALSSYYFSSGHLQRSYHSRTQTTFRSA